MKRTFADFEDKEKVACWSSQNTLGPHEVSIANNTKYEFNCNKCSHSFESALCDIIGSKKAWCPYCSGNRLCGDIHCESCFNRSFASFSDKDKVDSFSSRNKLEPHEVSIRSSKKMLFECKKCNHEFESYISGVTDNEQPKWCPYCSTITRLCGKEVCEHCLNKSFASFHETEKVNSWSSKNTIEAHEVALHSNKKIIFECKECACEFIHTPKRVTRKNNPLWCPHCSGSAFCGSIHCTACYDRSFASFHDKTKVSCWSKKNKKKAHEVTISSGKKAIFNCNKCNYEFSLRICDTTRLKGSWCPKCRTNKAMHALISTVDSLGLKHNLELPVICERRRLWWDMVVYTENRTFYIESDGPQHFTYEGMYNVSRKRSNAEELFKDQRVRDLLKEKHIRDNNKLLFRFSYRQTKEIPQLVEKMLLKSAENHTGIVYMDDIYW